MTISEVAAANLSDRAKRLPSWRKNESGLAIEVLSPRRRLSAVESAGMASWSAETKTRFISSASNGETA